MEQIVEYINQKYNPNSIIIYGSYANGTNNLNSDFDALVISHDHKQYHDTSFVSGIRLDVFVYPTSYFEGEYDPNDFIQIFDGKIIKDYNGLGKELQDNVLSYIQNRPQKSKSDVVAEVDWCVKMLARVERGDAEGMFRWHWVLTDSLEIFCDVMGHPYFGAKKSLKWMEEKHPAAFEIYRKALEDFSIESLESWIAYIKNSNENREPMIIETERLTLRRWCEADAESLYEYAKDPDVGPIAGWPPHKSVEESLNVIKNIFTGEQCYAICEKGSNKAIGAIELKLKGHTDMTDKDDECELGYWLGKEFWGRGYMPEAAKAVLRHSFENLGMSVVWCGYYDGNHKSKRVQEKVGFVYHHTCDEVEVPLMNEIRVGHTNVMTKARWEELNS